MKARKILALVVVLAMIMGTMGTVAFAAEVQTFDVATAEDLADAFNQSKTDVVINITDDFTVRRWVWVDGASNVTINGNGHTLTVQGIYTNGNGMYMFLHASDFHANDLTVVLERDESVQDVSETMGFVDMKSGSLNNVTIDGGHLQVHISDNADDPDAKVEIANCNFKNSDMHGIYTNDYGKSRNIFVSETDFENVPIAIIIRGNEQVSESTFTNSPFDIGLTPEGAVITGSTIDESSAVSVWGGDVTFIDNSINNDITYKLPASLTFAGNEFGTEASIIAEVENSTLAIAPDNTYPEGMTSSDIITTVEDVEVTVPVAEVAGKYYDSFTDAIGAAVDGDTITLLSDAALSDAIKLDDDIVIDINGNTLNMTAEPGTFAEYSTSYYVTGDVTFKNGNMVVTNSETKAKHGSFFVFGSLTFDDVDINAEEINSYALVHMYGPVNYVNGTTVFLTSGDYFTYGEEYALEDYDTVTISDSEITIDGTWGGIGYGINLDAYASVITMTNVRGDGGFRNVSGTITNTVVDVKGSTSTGIKNDGKIRHVLVVDGNSVVTLTGAAGNDIELGDNAALTVEDPAVVYAEKTSYADASNVTGNVVSKADAVYVQYRKTDIADGADNLEGKDTYEIVIAGADSETINELASADLTFKFDPAPINGGAMSYSVDAANGVSLTQIGNRFMFNYNGADKYEETGAAIVIGTITVEGYGSYGLKTDDSVNTNAVYATEIRDSIVDGFEAASELRINSDMASGDGMDGKVEGAVIEVPARDLKVTIDFNNAVNKQAAAYQDMTVIVSGGDLAEEIEIKLGDVALDEKLDIAGKSSAEYTVDVSAENKYTVNVNCALSANRNYTVTVKGAGYRTVRKNITMNEDKSVANELLFWNNVKDTEGADYLAGDIVKDNTINVYDLSAVVSYFGTINNVTEESTYAKYDLNRDGKVDSKDVAYVLVSWGK